MSDVARAYVELAHGIEQHQPGYIDGYYGPDEWARPERRPLDELAREAARLADAVAALADEERRTFLAAQLRAMQTTLALLQGETLPYREEVRRLYDIEPRRVDEAEFEAALETLDGCLPGEGSLHQRAQAFRERFFVPNDQLAPLFDVVVDELGRRARAQFPLPDGESFDVRLVTDEPWGAYNWYLGNYRSRIDVNTDLPTALHFLPDVVAHEAYPGHHTEHAIKEKVLWREQGRGEHTILLINAPECVVSEGIATHARRQLMSNEERREWLETELAPRAGLTGLDFERMMEVIEAQRVLRRVSGNAALLLHESGATESEVLAYVRRYRLATPEEAHKTLTFISHPMFRSYVFTYDVGYDLVEQVLSLNGSDRTGWFTRLLGEPVTPGVLRAWIAEKGGADAPPER